MSSWLYVEFCVILWGKFHYVLWLFWVFFFKQKTAYEIRLSLVGSEMCIRDRKKSGIHFAKTLKRLDQLLNRNPRLVKQIKQRDTCLLYTSDAADE